ncbi:MULTISPECIES: 50S ribosomal protein L9 [Oerskovia]|jgi:large subunit ribosomal protein L9|uniref:Large ribosomal subunit protein bL9 n=2 Tax=Oerskovia TaxID=162491 RepID=A0A163QK71_9CELL|nr:MULTISPECIES: 50S ribosomal protein L9 [Oerskovia]KRC31635.1 50S ribosomal protein L9 [Oerskovia sp. Root22]KRD35204.1 50S ribosomal protein L9 [Oerskovia sp. Root918]KZM34245.1 50S ribosomal protein L9 [Oerskovia enterophila]MBD7980165.1 50S ribosomal protein L9 [Oerskovia merdavium]OCI31423.1 50S ribosomal protein L9 [Oerskovia enterophila]
MAKLILTHEVTGLGEPGDVVEVKDGYARNFLVPRGLATGWSKGAESQISAIRKARKAREIATLDEAKATRDSLQSKPVVVKAKAGQGGRLFGAVTTGDIAEAVKAVGGPSVDKRKIEIGQPIKSTGSYTVTIRLHAEVSANIAVNVVAA